jgi:hypothetical protein
VNDGWPPPNYRPGYGTGYRVTLADFQHLVSDPLYRRAIAPLLGEWFGVTLSGAQKETEIRGDNGATIGIAALHDRIQSDPKMQYRLYQTAMDLWR